MSPLLAFIVGLAFAIPPTWFALQWRAESRRCLRALKIAHEDLEKVRSRVAILDELNDRLIARNEQLEPSVTLLSEGLQHQERGNGK